MDLHVFHHFDLSSPLAMGISAQLTAIHAQLVTLTASQAQELLMDAATQAKVDALNAAVAQETTLVGGVETLLNGLSAQIAELKKGVTDPAVLAALDAAAGLVNADNARTSAALVANTPAA